MSTKAAPLLIEEIGSFHIGGEVTALTGLPARTRPNAPGGPVHPIDPNGEIMAGQMYVQFVRLASPKAAAPLLMWHGGGMTGVTWETTPDGRPGWQMYFLRAGLDTYVSDAVERGRAGWAPFPHIYAGEPYFRTAQESWEDVFRFGPAGSWHADPARRRHHEALQFPADHFESFIAQFVPRWGCNDTLTQRAYEALLHRLPDRAIVMAHSQGGSFALSTAAAVPERVRAVIALEPPGAPDPARLDANRLKHVPHLFVWGDYLDRHPGWSHARRPAVERWCNALRDAGCDVTWIDLPTLGIHGNSHALMSDANSDEIAGIVLQWLQKRGLAV